MAEAETDDIGVLIVDDHTIFAESLAILLGAQEGITVVGVAGSGEEGIALAAKKNPRVVLIDYQMPGQDGVATAAQIKETQPETMVVVLTGATDDAVLVAAIEAGCSGYLTKDSATSEVVGAVRAAAAGEALISPAMLVRLLPRLGRTKRTLGSDLTERELDVLRLLADGASNKAIAEQLFLSVNTIRNHLQAIFQKLHAHSKLEAVSIAVREGLIAYPAGG